MSDWFITNSSRPSLCVYFSSVQFSVYLDGAVYIQVNVHNTKYFKRYKCTDVSLPSQVDGLQLWSVGFGDVSPVIQEGYSVFLSALAFHFDFSDC